MTKEVDLIEYLPPFMQEFAEMRHIMTAEQPDIQALVDDTETVKNNQFILTCDEDGISRYEEMLGITAGDEDSIESRISRVLSRWNDSQPYTVRSLGERLKALCGEGGYLVTPKFKDYELDIWVSLSSPGQADELDYVLAFIIPMNLVVNVSNEVDRTVGGSVYAGAGSITTVKHVSLATPEE